MLCERVEPGPELGDVCGQRPVEPLVELGRRHGPRESQLELCDVLGDTDELRMTMVCKLCPEILHLADDGVDPAVCVRREPLRDLFAETAELVHAVRQRVHAVVQLRRRDHVHEPLLDLVQPLVRGRLRILEACLQPVESGPEVVGLADEPSSRSAVRALVTLGQRSLVRLLALLRDRGLLLGLDLLLAHGLEPLLACGLVLDGGPAVRALLDGLAH